MRAALLLVFIACGEPAHTGWHVWCAKEATGVGPTFGGNGVIAVVSVCVREDSAYIIGTREAASVDSLNRALRQRNQRRVPTPPPDTP